MASCWSSVQSLGNQGPYSAFNQLPAPHVNEPRAQGAQGCQLHGSLTVSGEPCVGHTQSTPKADNFSYNPEQLH